MLARCSVLIPPFGGVGRQAAVAGIVRQSRTGPPVWLMRQAGRYLPEYRALRERAGGFLELCFNPELAAEATLSRSGGSASTRQFSSRTFSSFRMRSASRSALLRARDPGSRRLTDAAALNVLRRDADQAILAPIYETVRRVKARLPNNVTLIGFCGAPWTVATYMVAGRGTPDQMPAKQLAAREPIAFGRFIDKIVDVSARYLVHQLQAGADCVQIFDTWAGAPARR